MGRNSKYRIIFEHLISNGFELAVSNEILSEYVEKFEEKWNDEVRDNLIKLLLALPNLKFIHPTFRWELIVVDRDDNKFVDCGLAAQADFIVTEDKHFRILKDVSFPRIEVIGIDAFVELLEKGKESNL